MGDIIPIIVTGSGAPGIAGTIYALRHNPDNLNFKIITTDIYDDVVGKYLSDRFFKIPPPENKRYIYVLKKIVLKEKVKVILPQTTREILVLSQNLDTFAKLGVSVVVSSCESIKISNDKFLLLEHAKKVNVPYPIYYLTNSKDSLINAVRLLGYPQEKIVVKPRISNGMRGLRILTEEKWNVKRFLSEKPEGIEMDIATLTSILGNGKWPELLVTEYLPGPEYTVDIFCDESFRIVIPRLREKIRSGITFDAKIELRNDLIKYSQRLAQKLNLKYCFGFQFKVSKNGIPKLLECNPRVQGSMISSVFAGFNIIYYSVMKSLGKKLKCKNNPSIKNGLKFKRYWGGIASFNGKSTGRV